MDTIVFSDDEEKIFGIIDSNRKEAFDFVKDKMFEAFDAIGSLLAENSMLNINGRKINGISHMTLKDLYRMYKDGKSCYEADKELVQIWFIEFIRAQSLSFEVQKTRYPNFMKPWSKEDDERLERLWCEGVKDKELSKIFQRHPSSISARIARLELVEKYG